MTDVESLNETIQQYEAQLSQVQEALSNTKHGPDRDNLVSLCSDIKELINLTKEHARGVNATLHKTTSEPNHDEDPMEKEYALFKAVLEDDSAESRIGKPNKEAVRDSVDIEDELKALEGTKCRAPHGSGWGGIGHHNAMVSSVFGCNAGEEVTSINDIKVRVMFTNPTHKEMLPCPYYLDGACRFSDEQCHYSHGEIVPLSSLEEYREPDFSIIKMGSRVLAKQKNKLWHRAVVLRVPDTAKDEFRIKFEASGTITEVNLHDLFPLNDTDLEMSDSSDDSGSENEPVEISQDTLVQQSLLTAAGNEALGSWERHTRGIGSKLMADMGYVTGTGLGKRADGRIEPVEVSVLPAGKSLDHCMELREKADGDKDLFSVQRRLKKQQRAAEQLREKQYKREVQRERSNVFNFINATLGDKREDDERPGPSSNNANLKTETSQKLNVACLQVGENIRRLEKEVSKLEGSLGRHTKGTPLYNNVVLQRDQKRKELDDSRKAEKKILTEQNQRRSKAKLTIF